MANFRSAFLNNNLNTQDRAGTALVQSETDVQLQNNFQFQNESQTQNEPEIQNDFRLPDPTRKIKLVISTILLLLTALVAWRVAASFSWPHTNGRVEEVFVGTPTRNDPNPVLVNYSYSVDGTTYSGTRKVASPSDEDDVAACKQKYQFGTLLPVYYNPIVPSDCIAQPGEGWQSSLLLALAFLFTLVPTWVFSGGSGGTDSLEKTLPLLIRSKGHLHESASVVDSAEESQEAHAPTKGKYDYLDRLRA